MPRNSPSRPCVACRDGLAAFPHRPALTDVADRMGRPYEGGDLAGPQSHGNPDDQREQSLALTTLELLQHGGEEAAHGPGREAGEVLDQ